MFFMDCHLAGRKYHDADEVWDELKLYVVNNIRCWFSAIDIIRAINDEADQLVSVTHDFEFETPDEKKCAVDALCMIANAKNDVHLKHLKH